MAVDFHVKLTNEKNTSYEYKSTFKGKEYLRIDPQVFITIKIRDSKSSSSTIWDSSKSVMMTSGNIYLFVFALRRIIRAIYKCDIFELKKNGEIIINIDMAKKYNETIQLTANQAIMIIPSVIYDDSELTYEGVRIFINNNSNIIDLPIQYLEALLYTFEKIDLFAYSQSILNYISFKYNGEETADKEYRPINKIDFSKPLEVKSNYVKPSDDNIFNGLKEE